jgi:hypothetical protein
MLFILPLSRSPLRHLQDGGSVVGELPALAPGEERARRQMVQ